MRKLVIALLCVVGVAVVIDFAAAAYAEYRVSRELRTSADLSADPAVTIRGFSFLAQAIRGRYKGIDIIAQGVQSDMLGETRLEASLEGVRIPARNIAEGRVSTVPVDKLYGRVKFEATELGQLLGVPDLEISAPPGQKSDGTGGSGGSGRPTNGEIVLTGTVPINGEQTRVSVRADLLIDGTRVRIVARDYYYGPTGGSDTPALTDARPAVLQQFSRTVDTRQLPFGVVPTAVYAQGSQIVIEGTAEHLTIDLDQLQKL